MKINWTRHSRFLIALGLGLILFGITYSTDLSRVLKALISFDAFFVAYLAMMLWVSHKMTTDDLRRHSEQEDEGITLIMVIALGSVAISMASVMLILSKKSGSTVENMLALAAVPLGWSVLHMLGAYHYAHLYYSSDPDTGLDFPGAKDGDDPGTWDFLYFSYIIGMTAQVSDVQVTTSQLRRVVLLHSVGAFFYNTVLLALAVNAALQLGG